MASFDPGAAVAPAHSTRMSSVVGDFFGPAW